MTRVVINMAQTEHEHVYANIPVAHPEYLWLGCSASGNAAKDCGESHYWHENCLADTVYEFHPLNWNREFGDDILYTESATVDYLCYDDTIERVKIHMPRQHRHSFEIAYPLDVEEDYFVHIDNFPGWGFTGGCWSDFPKTVISGCFFTKDENTLYNIHVEISDPITMVAHDGTTGQTPKIGNDVRVSHYHEFKVLQGNSIYCAEGSVVEGLVRCARNHEDCFYGVKTEDDTPTGTMKTTSMPGYYPPPAQAYPYPPEAGYESYYLDRPTDSEEN